MWEKLYTLLEKNWDTFWDTFKKAPLAFILVLVLVVLSTSYLSKLYYEGQINTIKERLSSKDDMIAEYRERLKLNPQDQTKYSTLTNKELTQRTLGLAGKLRHFLEEQRQQDWNLERDESQVMRLAKSDEEVHKAWQHYSERRRQMLSQQVAEFEGKYKTEAIVLRNELRDRLPEKGRQRREVDSSYERTINQIDIRRLTDDLEQLAKNLP